MKKRTICKATQKCTDCRAYVTRCIEYNNENGFDCDVWDECAFGYVKQKEQPTAEQISESIGKVGKAAGFQLEVKEE